MQDWDVDMSSLGTGCPACAGTPVVAQDEWFGTSRLLRCSRCNTEWVDPQPTDEQLAQIYDADYYEPWSYEGPTGLEAMKRKTFAPLLDGCELAPGAAVLDVGCATGTLLGFAAERGHRVFGIDLNAHAVEAAMSRVPAAQVHAGTLEDEPFDGQLFDAIVMVDLIEHVRDPRAELVAAASRLAPNGRIAMSTPRVDSVTRRLARRSWPNYREEHLTYFSLEGLRRLLEGTGLRVLTAKPTLKAITLAYAYGQARAFPVKVVTPLTTAAYKALPFARHSPVRLPFGEMTVISTRS
jgi:2-polyprenyl-3-methyl-5-hydroxy-6-metoxy-1,4-benzoquinol methylase